MMRSHKNSKQRLITKKGFLRKRIAGQEPTAGDGWSSEAITSPPDHCNEMGGNLKVFSKCDESLNEKTLQHAESSSKLCPLAQDEIAISDAAEVSATTGHQEDFLDAQRNICLDRPASEVVITETTDFAYTSAYSEEKKNFITSLGEQSLETNANVSKNGGDYESDESTTVSLSTLSGTCSLIQSSADVKSSELRTVSPVAFVPDSWTTNKVDSFRQEKAQIKSEDITSRHSKMVISGGINHLVEEILGELYQPFDGVRSILVRQARDILVCNYLGNLEKFREEFLQPAAHLLRNFKAKERICIQEFRRKKWIKNNLSNGKSTIRSGKEEVEQSTTSEAQTCPLCGGWPLCSESNGVAVHLAEIEPGLLKSGDYYLFVRTTPARLTELVLKYCTKQPQSWSGQEQTSNTWPSRAFSAQECVISTTDFGRVFAMEGSVSGPNHLVPQDPVTDDQMTALLQHMLVSVEKGIKRMRWELQQTSQQWTQTEVLDPAGTGSSRYADQQDTGTLCSQAASCCCCGLHSVDVKDSGVQTSPVEEQKAGPLDTRNTCKSDQTRLCGVKDITVHGQKMTLTGEDFVALAPSALELEDAPGGKSCSAKSVTAVDKDKQDPSEVSSKKDVVKWDAVTNGNVSLDDGYHDNSLSQPTSIFDVDEDVVRSKVAFIPGCRDRTGRVVVTLNCSHLQNGVEVSASQLTQVLMYYHSIPRKELAARGLLVLIDGRDVSKESLGILDESFCLLEGNIAGAINTVVFWKNASSGTDTSPRKVTSPFPQSAVKFEVVHLIEEVKKVIKPDQLPAYLGGEYAYDHQKWMEFRKCLEPFMLSCRSIGKRMIGVMQEMKGSSLPSSAALTTQSIEQHKKFVGQVFDDPQLVQLQQTGPETLRQLEEARRLTPNNHDFRESVERCSALYSELQRAIVKLVRLADKRLQKLEHCLHLRTLEEETIQVLSWLSKKGEETLNKHRVVANSLGGVKAQERDFEKFYFLAMRHIEKGNDLLEEAAMLGQKGNQDAFGMKDLAKSLKQHLSNFSTRLEDQREKLEDTSKCYQLLDKAYEWALEAMKFVSRLKMDQYTSPEQLSCLMKHLHHYLESHPPLGDETFAEMIELATKLENERLLEQCKVAQVRCRETAELIRTRHQTLMKAKQQIEVECVRQRQQHQETLLDQVSEAMATHSPKLYQPTSPLWTPFSTSTPCYPYSRRRSVSGLPYNLVSAPYSYFGASGISATHRRHESLGASLLISEEIDETSDPCLDKDVPIADEELTRPPGECTKEECSSASASASDSAVASLSSDGDTAVPTDVDSKTDEKTLAMPLSSLSLSQTTKLMKRSQTWQFEDDGLWDVLPPRTPCGHGQLTKNLPTRGSAESIPSITENDDVGLPHHNSKMGAGYPPVPVNTHLHQRGSSLNLQFSATSMADLRQNDEQMKQRRTVLLIMREMIQTERDYVKSLEYIIENYIPELLRDDIPQALRGKRNVIFGNIEKIYEFHNRYFLQELEQCENSPSLVGQCFLRHESYFYLYALYNKNKPKSDSLMAEYGSAFFKSKQLELGDKMDLASYLLKPVQRMGKYALLLKQLLKECPEKDPEYGTLTASKEMVNFQLRHGNDLLAMDAIRECDVNLKEQGCLLRQDEFLVWQGKSRKCLRQVFLFEDLILLSKARRDPNKKGHDIYQYKLSIKMTDIGLTEQLAESNTKFEIWFRKRKISDTYTLQAPNPEVRQAWIQEISKLLWKQALRNREVRLAEMSSMGIGNKPCLDIKPSQDQISDRSISISQLNKAPRFRNSIAVTTSDYLRNNKRPHSIISVSSSSSGSSQSSSGLSYGALNLGFDPNDSPKSRHRSVTQQSQCSSESGIIPDISLNYDSLTDSESHKKVERSNSSTSNESIGICSLPLSPATPVSPEEDAGIGSEVP